MLNDQLLVQSILDKVEDKKLTNSKRNSSIRRYTRKQTSEQLARAIVKK